MDERWVYVIVGLFLLFGLWMYAVNTVHIRYMALRKERLHTRIKTVCRLAQQQLSSLPAELPADQPELLHLLQSVERLAKGDEYLFVLDTEGRTWADGSRPGSKVRPLPGSEMTSGENSPLAKMLAAGAQGGGFVTYDWKHPRSGDIKPKLSYVAPIPNTPFVVGSGTYA